MLYLLDANTISYLIDRHPNVIARRNECVAQGDLMGICQPVYYELMRGLLKRNATRKQVIFRDALLPELEWLYTIDDDWLQAARFWATTSSSGRQLSDIDLLIGAMVYRLNVVLASSDNDFDALPVKREDWREPL